MPLSRLLTQGLLAAALLCPTASADPMQDIRALIGQTYDRPDAKVEIDPVIVVQDYAVANWVQGAQGGRALLKQAHGAWQILLCAGDGLRHTDGLVQAGVPKATAERLAQSLQAAEGQLDPARLKLFSLFGPAVAGPGAAHHDHH